jgi:hypothetical protein
MSLRRSRRIAGLAPEISVFKPSAAPAPTTAPLQNPPDAPETEVVMELTIRIPVRRFPPANADEKQLAMDYTRSALRLVESASTRADRIYYAAQLYTELARQPIIVAQHVTFRQTVINKMAELENELSKGPETAFDQDLEDAFHEMQLVLADLHFHPWYTPDPAPVAPAADPK